MALRSDVLIYDAAMAACAAAESNPACSHLGCCGSIGRLVTGYLYSVVSGGLLTEFGSITLG